MKELIAIRLKLFLIGAIGFQVGGCSEGSVNLSPVVQIEAPTDAVERSDVVITSSATDPDGSIMAFQWEQVSGAQVSISDLSSATLEFVAPEVESDQRIGFSLTVTDDLGKSAVSNTATILVKESLSDLYPVYDYDVNEIDNQESVFISALSVSLDPGLLQDVVFEIEPMDDSVAAPWRVLVAADVLERLGDGFVLPLHGLYSDYQNTVRLEFNFTDKSTSTLLFPVQTDPHSFPVELKINQPASIDRNPTYSYFYLKSFYGIVVLDIDGQLRWMANEGMNSISSTFDTDHFKVFLDDQMYELELSGETKATTIEWEGLSNIVAHHDVDRGKSGFLVEVDADKDGRTERIIESILLEVGASGEVTNEWDFGVIFKEYLESQGYSADNLVRDGADWFHMNSAIYDPADDSIIASSRESFVVKVDYSSGNLIWLLGDETKHWFVNYPPLQQLSLSSLDTKPMGQHSLSILDGDLMLFNNGQLSFQTPDGVPKGDVLDSSPAAIYKINPDELLAEVVWVYDPNIYSDICSSIHRDNVNNEGDYLVNYSAVDRLTAAEGTRTWRTLIQGVKPSKEVLFEFELETTFCYTSWQSRPLDVFKNLNLTK